MPRRRDRSGFAVRSMIRDGLSQLKALEELAQLAQELGVLATHLATAEAVMPADDPWREKVGARRGEVFAQLSSPKKRGSSQVQRQLAPDLMELKQEYIDAYLALHVRRASARTTIASRIWA